ncbi:hypothetical protein GV054_15955 [Marinomonas mediterranea]|jgi:hypothetical protein|uniref:DUF3829 domain-containing protein n=1 Tax=Marinomonas mediterranea (strain ATCC 700492 / JCM 21426 / NBRC 103028 / MMB-1) TaxID=717774 RepID=F2K2Z7_MARM1|nr:hypothetical protein [Marinomonas mediterranea]ADZ92386.1 hypothetical protein Marme_3168 [Marinomonas mediterranea MMB-1]WCN14382.1 hypothetical protein GV054_15955 [Marinomonas mediterranea]WCN18434.1 hypothetical protein GV053_16020 [Marinomonas mediterranea MMB-1]
MSKASILAIALASGSLLMTGCATSPDSTASLADSASESQAMIQVNEFKNALDLAESKLATAKETELDWFAPRKLEAAEEALADTKEHYREFQFDPTKADNRSGLLTSQTYIEAAYESLEAFNTELESGEAIRTQAKTSLADAFDYQTQLRKIDSQKYYPETTQELEGDLKELVSYIADGDVDDAIDEQPDLIKKQRALEIKTVTTIYLTDAQNRYNELKDDRISRYAPKSFEQANASLTEAKAFIATSPRETIQIEQKANAVLFSLDHCDHIADTAKQLNAMSRTDFEGYVLSYEKLLFDISQAAGAKDYRNTPIRSQGDAITAFIKAQKEGDEDLNKTIDQLKAELKLVKSNSNSAEVNSTEPDAD